MSLDEEIIKEKIPRRSFLKKAVSTLGALALAGSISTGIACKSPAGPSPSPPTDKYYNLTVVNQDIFNNGGVGGDVILNGTRQASGTTFSVLNGQINNLDVDKVSGYIQAYISVRDESGNSVFTRDNQGHHAGSIKRDATLYARLIPKDFDTVTLAKSSLIRDAPSNRIVNYNKRNINVGLMNDGLEPTPKTVEALKSNMNKINVAANGLIVLSYIGRVDKRLSDGVTYRIMDSVVAHHEDYNADFTVIVRSWLVTRPEVGDHFVLEELTQASTGLVADASPTGTFAYIGGSGEYAYFINDGERAIQLANLLPGGFYLDNNSVPGVEILEGFANPYYVPPEQILQEQQEQYDPLRNILEPPSIKTKRDFEKRNR